MEFAFRTDVLLRLLRDCSRPPKVSNMPTSHTLNSLCDKYGLVLTGHRAPDTSYGIPPGFFCPCIFQDCLAIPITGLRWSSDRVRYDHAMVFLVPHGCIPVLHPDWINVKSCLRPAPLSLLQSSVPTGKSWCVSIPERFAGYPHEAAGLLTLLNHLERSMCQPSVSTPPLSAASSS